MSESEERLLSGNYSHPHIFVMRQVKDRWKPLGIRNTHMENGKKDEESVNNESHNIGKRSEGEGHSRDNRSL